MFQPPSTASPVECVMVSASRPESQILGVSDAVPPLPPPAVGGLVPLPAVVTPLPLPPEVVFAPPAEPPVAPSVAALSLEQALALPSNVISAIAPIEANGASSSEERRGMKSRFLPWGGEALLG